MEDSEELFVVVGLFCDFFSLARHCFGHGNKHRFPMFFPQTIQSFCSAYTIQVVTGFSVETFWLARGDIFLNRVNGSKVDGIQSRSLREFLIKVIDSGTRCRQDSKKACFSRNGICCDNTTTTITSSNTRPTPLSPPPLTLPRIFRRCNSI